MSYRYTSPSPQNYLIHGKYVIPGKNSLLLPTSGKYSPKYSSSPTDRRNNIYSPSHSYSHKISSPAEPLSVPTEKYSRLRLSSTLNHRPAIPSYSTALLLEKIPLSLSSGRHVDDVTPSRVRRPVSSSDTPFGNHTKKTFTVDAKSHTEELPPKSPSSRRSLRYRRDKGQEKPPLSSRASRQRKEAPTTKNSLHVDQEEEEVKNGATCSEASRWIGCGLIDDPAILTADRGYFIWNKPRGKLHLIFRYGDTTEDFFCFLDPQFPGVKVSRERHNGKMEVIIDGLENPKKSTNRHHRSSACRNRPENNFEFDSKDGECRFLLESMTREEGEKAPVFKINFTLAL